MFNIFKKTLKSWSKSTKDALRRVLGEDETSLVVEEAVTPVISVREPEILKKTIMPFVRPEDDDLSSRLRLQLAFSIDIRRRHLEMINSGMEHGETTYYISFRSDDKDVSGDDAKKSARKLITSADETPPLKET